MAYVSEKAFELAREMRDRLLADFATVSAIAIDGTTLCPYFIVGAGTAGSQSALIEVSPVSTVNKDVLGNNQNVYTPYLVSIVLESTTATVDGTALSVLNVVSLLALFSDLAVFGCAEQIFMIANGAVLNSAGLAAITGTADASWPGASAKYPLMASI